jgi:hypothetical protein
VIYFIQDESTGLIKIGYTDGKVNDRLKALQTGCPGNLNLIYATDGDKPDERALHEQFKSARERGEWFRPASTLLLYLIEQAGVSGFDQGVMSKADVAPAPARKWPLSVYLAGKVGPHCWRRDIIECGLSDWPMWNVREAFCQRNWTEGGDIDLNRLPDWPVIEKAIFGTHSYTGPFFVDCPDTGGRPECGCGHDCYEPHMCPSPTASDPACFTAACSFGDDNHGAGATKAIAHTHGGTRLSSWVLANCCNAIKRSDLVFAWIDANDCYGTVAELGYAKALGKEVWIAGPRRFRDMWLVYEMNTGPISFEYLGASEALRQFLMIREGRLSHAGK